MKVTDERVTAKTGAARYKAGVLKYAQMGYWNPDYVLPPLLPYERPDQTSFLERFFRTPYAQFTPALSVDWINRPRGTSNTANATAAGTIRRQGILPCGRKANERAWARGTSAAQKLL